jgi:hypothetical protein
MAAGSVRASAKPSAFAQRQHIERRDAIQQAFERALQPGLALGALGRLQQYINRAIEVLARGDDAPADRTSTRPASNSFSACAITRSMRSGGGGAGG